MAEHDATAYGRAAASDYDELYATLGDPEAVADFVDELAAGGAVLELGIGTGRLAFPLLERGIEVHGIEGSPEMAEALRAKPRGEEIPVVVGDFSEVRAERKFAVALLAFNTIFALPDQDAQVRLFENVAAQLEPGGVFVVEAFVIDAVLAHHGERVKPRLLGLDHVELQVMRHDPVEQRIDSVNVHLSDGNVRLVPANHRYASPAELDLMARLAGMRLRERRGGYAGEPFVAASERHVSVYELPA